MQDRVGALIIKNRAVLLVTGYNSNTYWTPGGKVDGKDSTEDTLRRELQEELNVDVRNAVPFCDITSVNSITNQRQTTHYFTVEINGEPKPDDEITGIHWLTREEFEAGQPNITETFRKHTYPKLITANLV